MRVGFTGVPAANLEPCLPALAPLLKIMADGSNDRFATIDLIDRVRDGRFQLWAAVTDQGPIAACLTEIVQYPRRRACAIRAGAGSDFARWAGFRDAIRKWAATQDCTLMETVARPGWERVFTDYRRSHVFLERDI